MDDSGIESDVKHVHSSNSVDEVEVVIRNGKSSPVSNGVTVQPSEAIKKAVHLQKKIDQHREKLHRKVPETVDTQPKKSSSLVSMNRLVIPKKGPAGSTDRDGDRGDRDTSHLLVAIPSDESEDEFEVPLSRATQREIKEQLVKDGYNLDLASEDEDLDLIPPRPIHERCVCCDVTLNGCSIS